MAVVANVDADIGKLRLEDRIAEIARSEIEFFPETRRAMGNMMLSIFAEIFAVGIDNRGRVVVDTLQVFFINRNNQSHAAALRDFPHQLNRWTVRNLLDHAVPARRLLGAEVRPRKDLLHTKNLHVLACGFLDEFQMFLNSIPLDFFQ